MRIGFDNYLILLAHAVKLRSQDQFRRVGAVCASTDNRILSCGYNGLVSGFDPPEELYRDRENPDRELLTNHAEQNALSLVRRGDVHTIALTCSPCQNCSKLIASYGVKRVLYSKEYERESNFKRIFEFYQIEYVLISFNEIKGWLEFFDDLII